MSRNRQLYIYFGTFILAGALYRLIPDRMWGFAPQFAMAIFGGAVIKDKKWSFALPLLSMFISDLIFQLLYSNGLTAIQGFYSGQFTNYLLIAGITVVGFFINVRKPLEIAAGSLAAPAIYFLASNFLVWANGGGYHHPKTFAGMMQTFADGLPFFKGALLATVLFSTAFFGLHHLLNNSKVAQKEMA